MSEQITAADLENCTKICQAKGQLHKGNQNITNPVAFFCNKNLKILFWKTCAFQKNKSGRQWKLKSQKAHRPKHKAEGGQLQKGRMTQPKDVDLFLLLGPSFIKMHQNPTPGPSKTESGLKDPQNGE